MRWVVLLLLAGCAAQPVPQPSIVSAAPQPSPETQARQAIISRVMSHPAETWQAVTRREAEAAVTRRGRAREAEVQAFQQALRFEVETRRQQQNPPVYFLDQARARAPNPRDEAYCRSYASEIATAGANDGELLVGMLFGGRSPRENLIYNSCMRGFARTLDYLTP